VTVNRTVAGNISDIGPGEFGRVVDAAEQMLGENRGQTLIFLRPKKENGAEK